MKAVAVAVLVVAAAPLLGAGQGALLAQEPPHDHGGHVHGLGTVDFPNSGAPAAQEPFLRGIALLHSFEYEDAADAFREAQAADPAFALAYWGEALTNAKLLWGRDDPEAARSALGRLAPTADARLALAQSARERGFGAAVEALYVDADLRVRARGYADSLRTIAERDPHDLEAAAFASIAQLMAAQVGAFDGAERAAAREAAIAFAERVFRANRDHPGAAHYLIHAYDDPAVAERGLDVARAYAQIAPDAQHALHMPSHIFVQVGLWDDVVASNERAWAASRAWTERRNAAPTTLDFHSLEWLQHGYLQQGRYRAALALVDTARAVLAGADLTGSVDPYYVEARLAFRHAAETGDWRSPPVPVADPGSAQAAESRYAFFSLTAKYQAAVGAILHGDTSAASIDAFRQEIAARVSAQPGSGQPAIMLLHLEALLARAHGDRETAIALLRRASDLEDAIPPVGPPNLLPTLEWLGGLLLETGMADEAAAAYERALARWPNRSASLLGLARARRALGDDAAAARSYRRLLENWHAADPGLDALEEVRRGAAFPLQTPERSADYTEPYQTRALDIYRTLIGFRTAAGHGQVPAAAEYLAERFRKGGFPAADVRVLPETSEAGEAVASLVVRYRGDGSTGERPILLTAHMDVVDALPEDWERDPFTLTEDDGFFFGRGTSDDKFGVTMLTATFLRLKDEGFVPARDLVIAFTGDEETGMRTTQALVSTHRALTDAEFALNADAGGGVLDEDGAPRSFLLQTAEKTYATFELTVTNPGGHSSTPRTDNAIYELAAALGRLEAYRFPVMVNEATRAYFRAAAGPTGGEVGEAMLRLAADSTDEWAADVLWNEPTEVGITRTTCVPTMLRAGHAENALPQSATATVNCRIFPGVEVAEVEAALRRVVANPDVRFRVLGDPTASPASPLRDDVLEAVAAGVERIHPGTPIIPYMAPYGTDGHHIRRAGIPTYGIMGLFMKDSDRFDHGLNERVPVRAFFDALEFWYALLHHVSFRR